MRFYLLIFISFLSLKVLAQADTLEIKEPIITDTSPIESFISVSKLDPKRAAVLAAVFPGLGKVYIKQHWKLPVVYGGFILLGHYMKSNNDLYHSFRNAYLAESDKDPNSINPFPQFNESSLKRNAELFRRNRDMVMIFAGVFYLVNIAETHIAAHLREFNVNDNLAFEIRPSAFQASQFSAQSMGLSIVIPLNK